MLVVEAVAGVCRFAATSEAAAAAAVVVVVTATTPIKIQMALAHVWGPQSFMVGSGFGKAQHGSTLTYAPQRTVTTKKEAEDMALFIKSTLRHNAAAYHAGVSSGDNGPRHPLYFWC